VNLHNGKIAAYSPGLGQGATFVVELPVLKQSMVTVSIDVESSEQDSESTKIRSEGAASLHLVLLPCLCSIYKYDI
jgi:hypothetical protein